VEKSTASNSLFKEGYFLGFFITFVAIVYDYCRHDGNNLPVLLIPLIINLLILINHFYILKNHTTAIKGSFRFFLFSIAIIINIHIIVQGYFDWGSFSLVISVITVSSALSLDKNTTSEKPNFILRRIEQRFMTWLFDKITWFQNRRSLVVWFYVWVYVYLLNTANVLIAPLLKGQPLVVSILFAVIYLGVVYIISSSS
jgi:hypothetical protein